jgi:hypothetical protein
MFYADEDSGTSGYQTTKPLVVWDAVPGASSYDVEAGVWNGSACVFDNPLASVTATTAWTPLGKRGVGISPYSTAGFANPLDDGIKALTPGAQYCVRVRPRDRSAGSPTGDLNPIVIGTWTYLNSGGFSFDWTGYATGGGCSPSCTTGYLGANDYLAPVKGSTMGDMPVFRWNPVSGAVSYFVVVARDSGFTNVVDYVFTRVPAYAPRKNQGASESRTYPDETTKYYWAVLPSPNLDGSSAAFNPLSAAPSDFLKRTAAPSLLSPADGQKVGTWPTFQWTPVAGARVYEIQVDDASTFASPVDTKKTNSTAYTSEATYAADKLLYWRVRPLDDNLTPLTWSVPRTFQRKLPAPAWDSGLPTSGATTPTFTWTPITGAVSYDLDTDSPDGKHKQWNDLRSAALTYVYFYGTGVFGQRVRANFPATSGSTHGPWSTTLKFTKLLPPPANPTQSVSAAGVSFSWSPRAEAREYKVQVSRTPDFAQPVETATTDNTSFAPLLTMYGYLAGGRFYWRVAAVDEGRNVGRYSAAKSFSRPKGMRLSSFGTPTRGKRVTITFTVRRYGAGSDPVARARVRIWGVGISATSKLTRSDGRVTFSVRARRNGTLWAKATKSGFSAVQIGVKTR